MYKITANFIIKCVEIYRKYNTADSELLASDMYK